MEEETFVGVLGGLGVVKASREGGTDLPGVVYPSTLGKNLACKLAVCPLNSSLDNSSQPHFLGMGWFVQRRAS